MRTTTRKYDIKCEYIEQMNNQKLTDSECASDRVLEAGS